MANTSAPRYNGGMRVCFPCLVLLALLPAIARAQHELPPATESTPTSWTRLTAHDLPAALDQMAQLERELDRQRAAERAARDRLRQTTASLSAMALRIDTPDTVGEAGLAALRAAEAERAAREQERAQAAAADRAALDRNRAALQSTAAALLYLTRHPAGNAAPTAALAAQVGEQRTAITIATNRLLRAAAEDTQVAEARGMAERARNEYSAFARYTQEALRARHAALATQVAELQQSIETQSQTVASLDTRRQEIRDLVAKLIADETTAPPAEGAASAMTPAPVPAQTPYLITQPTLRTTPELGAAHPALPLLTPLPAMQPTASPVRTDPAAPEVPYEAGSEPLVSEVSGVAAAAEAFTQQGAAGTGPAPGSDTTDGTRRLFWRASPVTVRALAPGRVLFAQPFAGYRHLLIVDHGQGWRTLIGNLESCTLQPGEQVAAGSPLGAYQASSARGRPEPLWFEVRQGAAAVPPDACPLLPQTWEAQLFAAPRR